jgi:flagellar hook assembly protein FlgD
MGCQSPVGVPGAVELVTSFRVDPVVNTFVEPVNIRYSLRQPAFVTLRVVAEAAAEGKRYLVFPIQDKQKETSGTHHAAWLGTATDGFFVPKGKYLIELYAQATPEAKTQEYAVQVYIYRN